MKTVQNIHLRVFSNILKSFSDLNVLSTPDSGVIQNKSLLPQEFLVAVQRLKSGY